MTLEQMLYYKQLHGYSLDQLAELSGVPRGTLQKIFSGETKFPRYKTLEALEKVLKPAAADHPVPGEDPDFQGQIFREGTGTYGRQQGSFTLEDYYALPEEKRVELIDGVFYDMTAPYVTHQFAISEIFWQISSFIRKNGGSCIVLISPLDVQLDSDDRTMVEPDLVILCDRKKLSRRCVMGAPDFILEVLSPSTRRKDTGIKLLKYREAGVREYWMADLEKEKLVAYDFEEDELPVIYGAKDEIPVGIFGGELKISLKEAFRMARELES